MVVASEVEVVSVLVGLVVAIVAMVVGVDEILVDSAYQGQVAFGLPL